MRFSLKWLLIGTAYAVVTAAALAQDSWIWADIVWAFSLVAFALALVAGVYARGQRQIAAAGFVAFSACYLACLQFAESSVPTSRWLLAIRLGEPANAFVQPLLPMPSAPQNFTSGADAVARARAMREQVLQIEVQRLRAQQGLANSSASTDVTAYLRAGNAVATMVFGLLGCLLAPLALKAATPKTAA
jgi:hypothetical protein